MGGPNVKNTMVDKVLTFIAPHLCSGCGKIGNLLCDHCKYDIIKKSFNVCIMCRRPSLVGVCLSHHKSYENAWIVGERRGTLQRLIGGFKFQNMKEAALELAELLDARLPILSDDTILIPIPTAAAHIRERGYDHTLLITQYLSKIRGLPYQALLKRKNTATQHHSNRKERIEQALSAFEMTELADPIKQYVIVDDVITTGSTVEFAAKLLRSNGAQSVSVAALALQPLD